MQTRQRMEQTVAELERQIVEVRQQGEAEVDALNRAMTDREQAQAQLARRLETEAVRLHDTLDFLTPDTPPAAGPAP